MSEIYLAGGCFWGVEKYIAGIRGVQSTEVGYANGQTGHPTYEQVKYEHTGHAETVHVVYDGEALPLGVLLRLFWRIIDPVSVDRQGHDVGHQYRTGVYYTDEADRPVIEASLQALQADYTRPLAVECEPLRQFYTAEEYHQDYLDKNPGGYCHVPFADIAWVRGIDPVRWAAEN